MKDDIKPNIVIIVVNKLNKIFTPWGYSDKISPLIEKHLSSAICFLNTQSTSGNEFQAYSSIITGKYSNDLDSINKKENSDKQQISYLLGEQYHRIAYFDEEYSDKENDFTDITNFNCNEGFDEYYKTSPLSSEKTYQHISDFIQSKDKSKAFFMLIHTRILNSFDTNGASIDKKVDYLSKISTIDLFIDEILHLLNKKNTMIFLVGDSGYDFETNNNKKELLYKISQNVLHIPLILWLPTSIKKQFNYKKQKEQYHCSTIDIVPTILDILKIKHNLIGKNLLRLNQHRQIKSISYNNIVSDGVIDNNNMIKLSSNLKYPLKQISIEQNNQIEEIEFNLNNNPDEINLLFKKNNNKKYKIEPISFICVCNDFEELKYNLLASPIVQSNIHEWIIIDNNKNIGICQLYNDAYDKAKNDILLFVHQDIYLPQEWEKTFFNSLTELEKKDNKWGVISSVGVVMKTHKNHIANRFMVGHYNDPSDSVFTDGLPTEIIAPDEQWIGIRKSRNIRFDKKLPGFHCYGIDISLTARKAGYKTYAIDCFVWHKYKNNKGQFITNRIASKKIDNRETKMFKNEFKVSTDFIAKKWENYIPFCSTSYTWRKKTILSVLISYIESHKVFVKLKKHIPLSFISYIKKKY